MPSDQYLVPIKKWQNKIIQLLYRLHKGGGGQAHGDKIYL